MLVRSTDRKTAAAVTKGGNVQIANAFGLPSGTNYSCPGATKVCEKVCYAGRIEKQYKHFMANMIHNWNLLKDATLPEMYEMLNAMIGEFIAECDKKNAPKFFRIHHDGDFFSEEYAQAWQLVCRTNSEVTFWVYTRSFTDKVNVIPRLADIPNLSVYLSVDSENKQFVRAIQNDHPAIRLALLADTFADAAEEMLTLSPKVGAKCPELTKQIPLISAEKGGACFACQLCPQGKADIRFAIKKR